MERRPGAGPRQAARPGQRHGRHSPYVHAAVEVQDDLARLEIGNGGAGVAEAVAEPGKCYGFSAESTA